MPTSEKSQTRQGGSNAEKPSVDDDQVRQQSSKAAHAALQAQAKANELKKAAAGAGDADERQKLMEQAIDAQVEAESFGRTAKYLRSGAFQGLAVGAGLGIAPGATLGAITGTLVGSVSSTLLGGIGGGIGAAAGAINGPFWDLSKLAGNGIRKITGDLPGWAASPEQKKSLEKMLGQVNDQNAPSEKELETLMEEGDGAVMDEGWLKSVKSFFPSLLPSLGGAATPKTTQGDNKEAEAKTGEEQRETPASNADPAPESNRKKPRKLAVKSDPPPTQDGVKKKPRKLHAK